MRPFFLMLLLTSLFCSSPIQATAPGPNHIPSGSVSSSRNSCPEIVIHIPPEKSSEGTSPICAICFKGGEAAEPVRFDSDTKMIPPRTAKDEFTRLSCGHVFHQQCITGWFQTCFGSDDLNSHPCPRCRFDNPLISDVEETLEQGETEARAYLVQLTQAQNELVHAQRTGSTAARPQLQAIRMRSQSPAETSVLQAQRQLLAAREYEMLLKRHAIQVEKQHQFPTTALRFVERALSFLAFTFTLVLLILHFNIILGSF